MERLTSNQHGTEQPGGEEQLTTQPTSYQPVLSHKYNVDRHTHWSALVVVDLPDRRTGGWRKLSGYERAFSFSLYTVVCVRNGLDTT